MELNDAQDTDDAQPVERRIPVIEQIERPPWSLLLDGLDVARGAALERHG